MSDDLIERLRGAAYALPGTYQYDGGGPVNVCTEAADALSAAIARAEAAELAHQSAVDAIKDEIACNHEFMAKGGARHNENITQFQERLIAERDTLRAELDRLKKLPQVPKPWGGCPACGLGADGKATGYVCQRPDCPTRITCGSAV